MFFLFSFINYTFIFESNAIFGTSWLKMKADIDAGRNNVLPNWLPLLSRPLVISQLCIPMILQAYVHFISICIRQNDIATQQQQWPTLIYFIYMRRKPGVPWNEQNIAETSIENYCTYTIIIIIVIITYYCIIIIMIIPPLDKCFCLTQLWPEQYGGTSKYCYAMLNNIERNLYRIYILVCVPNR